MHEVAAFSKFALIFLEKDLALPGPVKFRRTMRILRPKFLDPMRESAPVFIGTVPFLRIVFAELHFKFIAFGPF